MIDMNMQQHKVWMEFSCSEHASHTVIIECFGSKASAHVSLL